MSTQDASLKAHPPSALPRGTRLGEFELRHVLGVGGFGIVYLAFDHALEREVAIKEYLPATLVGRTETMQVSLRSQSDAETFALGLKSFVNEARLLAQFDHPSLLKVLRFWEANGTAYMAMPVLRGHTVKDVRLDMQQPPDESWMRALLEPLLGAIERLHAQGVYHRDIAPDNIQIEPDGNPVLLDFGAARRVISDKSQSLTAILKPAYAPIEQYAEAGSVKQGPWTDLYALGATMHYLLLGRPPSPATARAVHDDLPPLSAQDLPGCSAEFLNVIDWMLAPRPADRPQTVSALRDVLAGRAPAPRRRAAEPAPPWAWERTVSQAPPAPAHGAHAAQATHAATLVMPPRLPPVPAPAPVPAVPVAVAPPPPPRPLPAVPALVVGNSQAVRSVRVPALIGLAVVVLVGVAAAFGLRPGTPPAPDLAASAAALAASAASAPLVAASPTDIAPAAPESASAATVAAVAATATALLANSSPAEKRAPPARAPASSTATVAGRAAASLVPATPANPAVPSDALAVGRPPAGGPAPSTDAAAPLPAAAVAGPDAICAGRSTLAFFVCMERECLRSELNANQHADCRKWRAGRVSDRSTD